MRQLLVIREKLSLRHKVIGVVLIAACFGVSSGSLHALSSCNPRAYGAKGDGVTRDIVAIQTAIDVCARQGGGTVSLVPGTYLISPIILKSEITLHLDKGATRPYSIGDWSTTDGIPGVAGSNPCNSTHAPIPLVDPHGRHPGWADFVDRIRKLGRASFAVASRLFPSCFTFGLPPIPSVVVE